MKFFTNTYNTIVNFCNKKMDNLWKGKKIHLLSKLNNSKVLAVSLAFSAVLLTILAYAIHKSSTKFQADLVKIKHLTEQQKQLQDQRTELQKELDLALEDNKKDLALVRENQAKIFNQMFENDTALIRLTSN